ncbi:mesoderm induction early response protein 1-like isoform X1 [Biomphalaria pfeifferi]|uniref:Mesoderm induction early response protein 1-like isoform X1 n=1 Tax=Biomphalaria pfeifferi TaxID=112525 RepID=A0AAD8CBT2_BIOPF|nr:mesoderm induction early response protein 1-like isoform X1 [Biomphalaria pfeifferi]
MWLENFCQRMAEVVQSDETSSPDTDKDFDPSADIMVHDYDDERTLDEEEAMTSGESCTGELDDLQKESEMPIEELMAQYAAGAVTADVADNSPSASSSSSDDEEIVDNDHHVSLHKGSNSQSGLHSNIGGDDIDLVPSASRSQTGRLLRSTSHPESGDSESSSDDENYEPIEEHKKTIQVGSDFQAVIPVGLSVYGDAPAYENEDRLLWDPSKIKDEAALNDYLCNVQREVDRKLYAVCSIPRGKHIRDDEQALFLLLQCDNNIEEAERRRKMQAVPPTDVMSLWSEDECRNFEDGLRLYGKNFHEIHHNKVRTRSVFELVHFYYLWKKTERHDIFAAKTRAEKRKYSLNPGVTDHMDRFLEEQEVELHQLMVPQNSEVKIDTNDDEKSMGIFSTGKTTIMSPSRHSDRGLAKADHLTPSKRPNYHHHSDHNGSSHSSPDHLAPKRLKLETVSPNDQLSPRKQKLPEDTSRLSPCLSSAPSDKILERNSELMAQPNHVDSSSTSLPVVVDDYGKKSPSMEKHCVVEHLPLPTISPCKSPSGALLQTGKQTNTAGDTTNPDITNCNLKPMLSEPVVQ